MTERLLQPSAETADFADRITARERGQDDPEGTNSYATAGQEFLEAIAACSPCVHITADTDPVPVIAYLSRRLVMCHPCFAEYTTASGDEVEGPSACGLCLVPLEPPTQVATATVGHIFVATVVCQRCCDDLTSGPDLATMPDPGHFAPGSPVDVAFRFVEAVFELQDWRACWALMDINLRKCRAQAWLWNNRHHDDIAGRLDELVGSFTGDAPTDPLWAEFADIELAQLIGAWHDKWVRQLGAASRPRPLGADTELVLLLPTDGVEVRFDKPTLVPDALAFTVRHTDDGPRIAAYGDFLPEPGWPPRLDPGHAA